MISFEEAGELLDEISAELPQEFYEKLNGGILLIPDVKIHPEAKQKDLYTMGEYRSSYTLGRYIVIYYGSFEKLYRHLNKEELKEELRKVLYHEFTHHVESLAGERGLEIKDKEKLNKYKTEK